MTQLIILDRDGVINYDSKHYIKSPDEWHAIPGSLQAIARLNQAGYRVAIATNQSGIARGYYTTGMLEKIHEKMLAQCAAVGGVIDMIVYCPHQPSDQCDCRKPKPGLLLKIAKHFQCSLTNVAFVGDKPSDMRAAIAAGAKPILINSNQLALDDELKTHSIPIYNDLSSYVNENYCD